MGNVLKPVGSLFGIGQEDDPTFNPATNRSGAYNKFADNFGQEYSDASQNAGQEVVNGAMTGNLFRTGGLNDRLAADEQQLASQGYGLQGADHEAYGQAAGNISRQFGQQEQDLSKSLNRRGLGGGSSGAAGAGFSGLAGSKNEMLAKAQTDIAQKRMADTTQRLQATRSQMQSLGMGGQQMKNQLTDQRLGGKESALGKSAGIESGVNDQGRQANEDAIGHKSKNIGDAWSEGTYSGTKSGTADATSSWMSMGGSGAMGMSDENNKTEITDGAPQARGFLKQIANSQDFGDSGAPKKKEGGKTGFDALKQKEKEDKANGIVDTDAPDMGDGGGGFSLLGGSGGSGNAAGMNPNAGGASGGGMSSMMSSMGGGGPAAAGGGAGGGGLMSLFGGMMSDENCKTGIEDGGPQIRGFLDSVEPHSYRYKDEYQGNPLAGEGEFVSPMAQELEQTELGADMVQDTPDGKVVDYGKGFGTLLAGMADVNKRLSAIEGRKK